MANPWRDLRFGLRLTAKNPGFTAVAVLTLALGIGANTTVFSVVRAALLTPVPIPHLDRVVMVWSENVGRGFHHMPASGPDYADWRKSGIFEQMGGFTEGGFNLRAGSRTDRVQGLHVTGGFFDLAGARPRLGRVFREQDRDPVVVLSESLWRSTFAADPQVLGKSVVLDGEPHTVIGVLPSNFPQFGQERIYAPLDLRSDVAVDRGTRFFGVIARLRAGLGLQDAQSRMDVLSARLRSQYPADDAAFAAHLQPAGEAFVEDAQPLVLVLWGAVGFVLLIACANIANLLLARGAGRVREMAIRAALGAGRLSLAWQLLTESVLLALLGGLLGVLPAWWGIDFIASFQLEQLPTPQDLRLNGGVLAFTVVLSLLTGVLFGLAPAWQVWKTDVNSILQSGGRTQPGGVPHRLRGVLVVSEIALTLVLLTGAGLMLRSLWQFRTGFPGFRASGVLTSTVSLTGPEYATPQKQAAYAEEALRRIRQMPGVAGAGLASSLPTSSNLHAEGLQRTDRPAPKPADIPVVLTYSVAPGYFRSLQMPLLQGRLFADSDRDGAPKVAIVDQWAAEHFWPHENPVGKYLKFDPKEPERRIIGVVGDVEQSLTIRMVRGRLGTVYLPFAQEPKAFLSFAVRTALEPTALAATLQKKLRDLDPNEPLFEVQTLEKARSGNSGPQRLAACLLSGFALMALLVAAIGVYGVVAYGVGLRTREIGVRMALGADRREVLELLVRHGVVLAATGIALGLAGAFLLTRAVSSLLLGVGRADPLTFASVAVVVGATALLASYLPARRATRLEPMTALRQE